MIYSTDIKDFEVAEILDIQYFIFATEVIANFEVLFLMYLVFLLRFVLL